MSTNPDPSSVGVMEGAYFVSKRELIEWLRQDFGFNNVDIRHCGNGLIYLKILDRLYPGQVPLRKAKPLTARQEWECLYNLKLLQSVFQDCSIRKHLEIEKLAKCSYQDNLEFLQWLKCFYDRFSGDVVIKDSNRTSYNPPSLTRAKGNAAGFSNNPQRYNNSNSSNNTANGCSNNTGIPSSELPLRVSPCYPEIGSQQQESRPQQNGLISRHPPAVGNFSRSFSRKDDDLVKLREELEFQKRELSLLQNEIENGEKEARFFFGKLRRLEIMSNEPNRTSFTVKEVQDVLFDEEDLVEDQLVDGAAELSNNQN